MALDVDRRGVGGRSLHSAADAFYSWTYNRDDPTLTKLYDKAVAGQWSAEADIDWSIDVDLDEVARLRVPGVAIARRAANLPGSPIASWGDREFLAFSREMFAARLSQYLHGEQGAMLTAAKLVETVPSIDAKYFAASQTMDEARHTVVFSRYLGDKVGTTYAIAPYLQSQLFSILEDSRWDIAYLGMQVVLESLALAAFGDMLRVMEEPLLRQILRLVIADEARHVAFGITALTSVYGTLTEAELLERQEFLADYTLRRPSGWGSSEVWQRMGVSVRRLMPYLKQAAGEMSELTSRLDRNIYAKLVPNVRKLGLLDANGGWLRARWDEVGLTEYEFADEADESAI